jgi:hypothetical protein
MLNAEMKQAIKTLKVIGLVLTSSPLQLRKGTLEFMDPMEKIPVFNDDNVRESMMVKYTLHANGYYRKYNPTGWGGYDGYQLNKTKKVKRTSKWGEVEETVRVLIPGQYEVMAARIIPLVINSRTRSLTNVFLHR